MPIISDKKSDQGLKIYDDSRLPSEVRDGFRDLEKWGGREIPLLTVISIWLGAKISVNLVMKKALFGHVNMFDRHVLMVALVTGIFGYSYVQAGFKALNMIDIDDLLFTNKENQYLGMYRKRLVENYPNFAGRKYFKNKELLSFDGVQLFETEEEVEPVESEEPPRELTAQELEYLARSEADKQRGQQH